MIRMIVTDLDGTLLAGKSALPQENVRALKRAMDAGVKVVIATGRMLEATVPIAQAIGVNAPLSLFNGAMTYDMARGEVLRGRTISQETAARVLREIEARGGYVHAFPGKGFYFDHRCEWTDYYENKIGVQGVEVGGRLSEWLRGDVFKLLCLGESDALTRLAQVLAPLYPELSFVKSAQTHLEIVRSGVDKASGVRDVAEVVGIAPEETMAFGDEMNDLPMILYAGAGYAMENAVDEVRRAAKHIAPRNTDCGVARIVNLFLDEGRMGRG